MRCGSQPDQQQPGVGVAEARHGSAPVALAREFGFALPGDITTIGAQFRTSFAFDDAAPNS
jgi:hypothetical protein